MLIQLFDSFENSGDWSLVSEREFLNYNRDIFSDFTEIELDFFRNFDSDFRYKDVSVNPYIFVKSDGIRCNLVIFSKTNKTIWCYKRNDRIYMVGIYVPSSKKTVRYLVDYYKCGSFSGFEDLLKFRGIL